MREPQRPWQRPWQCQWQRRTPRQWQMREGTALVVGTVAVVLATGVLPIGQLVLTVFGSDPIAGLHALGRVAATQSTLRAAETTLIVALASGLLALGLGLGAALLLGCTDVAGKRALAILFVLSLMVAPQVAALAFKTLAGPASPLLKAIGLAPAAGSGNPMLSLGGIIFVLALHHAPLAAVTIAPGLRAIPRDVIEAAGIDGARPWQIVIRIVLPLLAPHLLAAAALVTIAGFGNFGIPALLGLPVGITTLPTLVYQSLVSGGPAVIADAARLSLVIALLTAAGVWLALSAQRRAPTPLQGDLAFAPFVRLGRARAGVSGVAWGVVGFAVLLPFLSLLATALVPAYGVAMSLETVTLDRFAEVLLRQSMTRRAFVNSLWLAASAASLLVLVSILVAYTLTRRAPWLRGVALPLIELPYALPGVVVAIICILLFLRPLPLLGVSLYATHWIILAAYLIRFLPLVLKPTLAAMVTLPIDQEEAAATAGARLRQRLWFVVLPVLMPSAAAGGVLAFMLAFNELTVSALLWSAGTETLGVALLSLDDAGLGAEAAAIGVSATLAVAALVLALDAIRHRLPDGVLPWVALADDPRANTSVALPRPAARRAAHAA